MKKYFILIITLSLSLISISCVDDLNTQSYESIEEKEVWNNAENAQMFVNGMYHILKDRLSPNDDPNQCDGNSVTNGSSFVQELMTADDDFGWDLFEDLRACNQVITNVESSETIDEDSKNELIGQARFLRAALYYTNARKFGRLILIDRVLTPNDELELPRTETIKETYDAILQDLDIAAELLPSTNLQGRVTSGAAYALKAEVCLQGAAYLDDINEKLDYYEQSRIASEKLFSLGKYSLGDYGGMFNSFSESQSSPEIILATWYLESKNTFNDTFMMALVPNQGGTGKLPDEIKEKWPMESFEGWMGVTPSQELVDAYEVIDEDGIAKDWNQTSYYKNYKQGVDFVSNVLYKNRDARFYETVVYDSCKYFNSILTFRKGGNMWYENNREGNSMMSKTGYIYKKTVYQTNRVYGGLPSNWCLVHLRLGRSYLNYVESLLRLVELGKNKTYLSTAIEYLNEVRTKHGNLPPIDTNLGTDDVWKKYKRERRVELVFENDYYWSLLRWAKEEGVKSIPELNTDPKAIIISEDGKSFEFTSVPVVADGNRRKFTEKRFLLPIPRSEITTNSKLANDQNPGWE